VFISGPGKGTKAALLTNDWTERDRDKSLPMTVIDWPDGDMYPVPDEANVAGKKLGKTDDTVGDRRMST